MQTKFEIIETDSYILAVSDEEIKDENWVITDLLSIYPSLIVKVKEEEGILWTMNDDKLDVLPDRDRKIIAYQPKGNAPELEGILEILVEDDVEKLAKEFVKTNLKRSSQAAGVMIGFIEGYKAATKAYSEEDLVKIIIKSVQFGLGLTEPQNEGQAKRNDKKLNNFIDKTIQSLNQPKTPKWFVAEYKTEYTEDGLDYQSDELKTTTINGKEYLVGTYLYE
jgi:hypothetical protein